MIEIKHARLPKVIHRIDADSLEGADLRDLDLSNADFRDAGLEDANLSHTNLEGACLRGAYLNRADFTGANLAFADLPFAQLRDAILIGANLSDADLSNAKLIDANLWRARIVETNLTGALLAYARMGETLFALCPSLADAEDLAEVHHDRPSTMDFATLRECLPKLPNVFLRGIGLANDEIENLRAMYTTPIYFSCFISYARAETEFAERLHNDLEAANVPCWLDQEDLRGGDYWRQQINEAIRMRDKTILVCSETSLLRVNVVEEILATIADERRTGKQKLFPITIDHAVYDPGFQQSVAALLPRQQQREDWLTYVSDYHIPDYSGWKDHDTYQKAFQRLLRDLRNASAPTE